MNRFARLSEESRPAAEYAGRLPPMRQQPDVRSRPSWTRTEQPGQVWRLDRRHRTSLVVPQSVSSRLVWPEEGGEGFRETSLEKDILNLNV